RVLPAELLKETEEQSSTPANQNTTTDFAATQRQISRSYIDSNKLAEDVEDESETPLPKVVKEYDDIDSLGRLNECSDEEDNEGSAFYEIPVARQQLSLESISQSQGADGFSITSPESTEELQDDVIDSTLMPPSSVPPPLPPRKEIRFSDSGSRNSINFDDKPPELPFRPPLPKRNELCTHSDKSDRSEKSNNSDPELSGDGDSTSYESFEEGEHLDTDIMNKLSIQLPKKPIKRRDLQKSKKLSKSRSSSQWEISAPFRKLENINISGELYYKGKLKWNRRIVAISNGCLAMYKPDKEARPSLVIPISGYEAYMNEREGRRGFEVKMSHPNDDSHTFSADFKEWALLWIEHINGTSKGQTPPKYHTHLARSFSGDGDCGAVAPASGSKPCVQMGRYTPKGDSSVSHDSKLTDKEASIPELMHQVSPLSLSRWNWKSAFYSWSMPLDQLILTFRRVSLSTSNLSTGSEGGSEDSSKPKIKGSKVMRMGSFAFRATQFFENIGKKTTNKRKSHHGSLSNFRHSGDLTDVCDGIVEEASMPTSSSAGNLAKNKKTISSDSISSSTLTKTENALSIPAHLDAVDCYLLIFSSFNKRCWGKRWCLVNRNMFECYKSDSSKQCELSFLLKPCILRRAVAETNSENGLMIMDAIKEKITVEPLSKDEMGQWVRVFLNETSTPNVPEGLEEYIKEPAHPEGDSISVVSFSVLKQWNPSSHDYEDPDTVDAAAKIHAQNVAESEVSLHSNTVTQREYLTSEPVSKVEDSLPVYQKNKHTTDSGFYSAKGANSDSDSCHEICDLNLRYADTNSVTLKNVTSLSIKEKKSDKNKNTSLTERGRQDNCIYCRRLSAACQCACLTHSSPSLSSATAGSKPLEMVTSESHLHVCRCTPVSQNTDSNTANCECPCSAHDTDLVQADSSMSTSLTLLHPNIKEYSMVLKKSERSLKSSESYSELQNGTMNMTEHDSYNILSNNDTSCVNFSLVRKCSLETDDNETSYYEPICALDYTASTSADENLITLNSNSSPVTTSGSNSFNHLPPVPTSPFPHPVLTMSHTPTATSSESKTHIFKQSDVWTETSQSPGLSGSSIMHSEENENKNASVSTLKYMSESKAETSASEKGSFDVGDQSLACEYCCIFFLAFTRCKLWWKVRVVHHFRNFGLVPKL
ncbi:unnamed protein product, partial [Candidula unifasciata]